MTIASTTVQTSGSAGNGATTTFSFSFHIDDYGDVEAEDQIQVILETLATGVETILTRGTHYTVSVNGDQTTSPGGSITTVATYSSAYKIWIRLAPSFLQSTDYQNQGGFLMETVEDQADQHSRQIITLLDRVRRSPRVGVQAGTSFDGEMTGDLTAGYTPIINGALTGWTLGTPAAGATVSSAMVPVVTAASIGAAQTALGSTIYPVAGYSNDLNAAIAAAAAAGGGRVIVDRDIDIASTVTPKNDVQVLLYPGVVLTWTGGSSVMFQSPSNNVLNRFSIMGYGATLALGASCTGALKLYGPYRCAFWGFEITGSLTTSVAIDVRGDSSAGTNPIGNRNAVYCSFGDIVHSGTCGRFLRLYGSGTDGVSATYPVVLNTFHNMHCEDARVIGIDFARWCDHNFFSGVTRIGIVGNNSVGVNYNSENPTVNCGVYTNHFDALAVDSFGTYTGRVGLVLNNCKDVLINHFYNYPLAEGGAYTIASTAASYVIGYFNEALGLIQFLTKGELFAGNDASTPVRCDIKNYDTTTSVAQYRAISGAATGATVIMSADVGISYQGNTSNHPIARIVNNTEVERVDTSYNFTRKVGSQDQSTMQANGGGTMIKHVTALLSAVSGATVVATNLIPAGAKVRSVTTRVTTALGGGGGTTGYQVGDGSDADRWGVAATITQGTQTGAIGAGPPTADPEGFFAAAQSVTITAVGGNFNGTGAIRVVASYTDGVAPTS